MQAKRLLAKKKAAAAKKSGSSAAASLAAKEAKERAAKKTKVKDKKNYNQVTIFTSYTNLCSSARMQCSANESPQSSFHNTELPLHDNSSDTQ